MTSRLRFHWPILVVILIWAILATVVPTLLNVATTDDWGYSRLVEIFHETGELQVFPVIAATSVFPVLWGSTFGAIFGFSLGIARLSTVVLSAFGAIGLYAMGRELSISPGRSAIAAAVYLLNPLSFVLSYTYMTDPFLTATVILATFGYVRGFRTNSTAWMLAGSLLAGCAFLTRQQGALVPLAVAMWMVFTGHLRFNFRSIVPFLRVVFIPLLMTVSYYLWLALANDVPDVQQSFTQEIQAAGIDGLLKLIQHLPLYMMMYAGFFVLPVTLAALFVIRPVIARMSPAGWYFFGSSSLIFSAGIWWLWEEGKRFPYVPQFMGAGRLGPVDVRGSRPKLIEEPWFSVATIVCAVSVILALLALSSTMGKGKWKLDSPATLIACILVWQAVGIFPPSYHYLNRGYSLDRYFLPLLPLAVILVLWAIRDVRMPHWPSWILIGLMALFSAAATRDFLVTMDVVWDTAQSAEERGIPLTKIDAGAAWDGYHLYTYSVENGITRSQTPSPRWWIPFYAKAVDSTYVVAIQPVRGYELENCVTAHLWLDDDGARACLYRHKDEVPLNDEKNGK